MRTRAALLAAGVILTACAREDGEGAGDERAGADSTGAPQAPKITVGDTSAPMSPADKASADEPSPSASGGKSSSGRRKSTGGTPSTPQGGTPTSDSAPPPPPPPPGMRPTARDRQPWQVPPSDDTTNTDSTRPPGNPPAP